MWMFCVEQENYGCIVGAKAWSPIKWLRMTGRKCKGVKQPSPLWEWQGENLLVNFYEITHQKNYENQVEGGRKGGLAKAAKYKAGHDSQPPTPPSSQPPTNRLTEELKDGGTDTPHLPELEIPSEAEVLQIAAAWPGDQARGIPAVIPEGWALRWWGWRKKDLSTFPNDWRDDLQIRFRSDWIAGLPMARNLQKKGAAKPGRERGEILQQLTILRAELAELTGANAALKADEIRDVEKELEATK